MNGLIELKVGERLVVQGRPEPAYVESIEYDPQTARTVIRLDWREFGKSRVYLHDEGTIWTRYSILN